MPVRTILPNAMRLWALILLAVIGLQVAAPVGAPLQARHGSAFNAATYDVAIAPQRRLEVQQQVAIPQPALPPVAAVPLVPATVHMPALPAARPDSTGPPAGEILVRQPAPRGPPPA